jgi:ATP-independent RNA helicase DbpA
MDVNKILNRLHIEQLNPMQEASMDAILHTDNDVILLSPTGTGKTLAYLLPLIQCLNADIDDIQAVVLVPGRELALQSSVVLKDMGCGLRTASLYGGRMTMEEHKMLRQVKPQIVFATPGRLNDHLNKGNILPYAIKYLVIDEFDKCLEMGFRDEMKSIIDKLIGLKRHILLSATNTDDMPDFVNMGQTTRLDYTPKENNISERVSIFKVSSPEKDKLSTLEKLLCSLGEQSSVVFLNYRDSVERTSDFLIDRGFTISAFHGGLDQKMRENALYKFSNGSANILVSTDLASRGLDIPNIANIIHYHIPTREDEYIHRVGRTARWDKMGRSFFIVGPEEQIPEFVEGSLVEYTLPENNAKPAAPKMVTLYIGKGKKDKISKMDIVGFLCKICKLNKMEIGRIDVKDRYAYVAIVKEKLNQVLKLSAGEKLKGIRTVIETVK